MKTRKLREVASPTRSSMCRLAFAMEKVVQEKEGYTSSKTLISDQRLKPSVCRKNVSTYTMSSIPVFHVLHPNSKLFRINASCRSAPAVDTCLVVPKNTVHQHLCTGVCSLFALVPIATPRPSWNQRINSLKPKILCNLNLLKNRKSEGRHH